MKNSTSKIFNLFKVLICFFILLLFPSIVYSQDKIKGQYHYKHYSIENGLPSSETYDVNQDKEGNIWIATDRGLAKYNSRKFKIYTKKDGLIDDVVFKIYKDTFGKLWFLTRENDLCYYENGEIKKYRFNHLIHKYVSQSQHSDKDICILKNKTLILSIRNLGKIIITNTGKVSREFKDYNFMIFKQYENQYLWSYNSKLSYEKKVFFGLNSDLYIQLKDEIKPTFISSGSIKGKFAATGDNHKGYFLYNNTIYDFQTKKKIITNTRKTVIQINKFKNELWVGYSKFGVDLYRIINGKPTFKRTLLKNYSISNVFKDNQGGYWFTTLEEGVFYLPFTSIEGINKNNGLLENHIINLTKQNNEIYISYFGGNYQIIKDYSIRNKIQSLNTASTFGMVGKEIISSDELGNHFKGKIIEGTFRKDFYSTNESCIGIKEDLIKFYPDGQIQYLAKVNLDNNSFQAVMEDGQKIIWAGNTKGLHQLINGKLIPYQHAKFSFKVTDLLFHENWEKIIATRDGGLFIFKNKKFTKINNLLSEDITAIEVDYLNRLWVGTNFGVNLVSKRADGTYDVGCITKNYGLYSNEITSITTDSKYAWIATKKGLSKIDISNFHQKSEGNKIILNSIILNNEIKLNLKKNIVIPHDKDVVSIHFGTINFITKGKYRYRLNSASSWTIIQEPIITLLNPQDGIYDLEVSFLNENNKWIKTQKIVSFEIEPPFWRKLTFKIVIIIIIGYLIYLLFLFKKKQFETKQKLIILEQKALFAQMNPHFIFNTLNSIQSFLIYNENDKAEYFLSKFSKLLRETLHISRNSSVLLNKEIDILEKYLELEQMRFSNKFQWEIIYNTPEKELNFRIPNMLIQPYIENSIKHGFTEKRSDFKIDIVFTLIDSFSLKCEVIDNGIGRDASQLNKKEQVNYKEHISYGEKITKERLTSYNKKGKYTYGSSYYLPENNSENTGTKVEIMIPILNLLKE